MYVYLVYLGGHVRVKQSLDVGARGTRCKPGEGRRSFQKISNPRRKEREEEGRGEGEEKN